MLNHREDDTEEMFEEDENVCDTSDDDEDDTGNFEGIIINDNDFELTVDQLFSSVLKFKRALKTYAIKNILFTS